MLKTLIETIIKNQDIKITNEDLYRNINYKTETVLHLIDSYMYILLHYTGTAIIY